MFTSRDELLAAASNAFHFLFKRNVPTSRNSFRFAVRRIVTVVIVFVFGRAKVISLMTFIFSRVTATEQCEERRKE